MLLFFILLIGITPSDLLFVLVAQSSLTLLRPHEISQARILDWVAISFSRDLFNPGIKPMSPALAGGFFTSEPPGKLISPLDLWFI